MLFQRAAALRADRYLIPNFIQIRQDMWKVGQKFIYAPKQSRAFTAQMQLSEHRTVSTGMIQM